MLFYVFKIIFNVFKILNCLTKYYIDRLDIVIIFVLYIEYIIKFINLSPLIWVF